MGVSEAPDTVVFMSQDWGVRPTRKCLDALGISPPTLDVPLHLVEADPITVAQSFPATLESGGLARIVGVKDRVWFKLKTGRWRGAVTQLTDQELVDEGGESDSFAIPSRHRWWLGSVGRREEGSKDDFYAQLLAECARPWSPDKPHRVDSSHLLPQPWDLKRLRAELALAQVQAYESALVEAAARSLRCGQVVTAQLPGLAMGVLIRADGPDQYVAFIAEGVYDPNVLAVMMSTLPGVDLADWAPEPGSYAGLHPASGQIVWSAPLSTEAAAEILQACPSAGEAD